MDEKQEINIIDENFDLDNTKLIYLGVIGQKLNKYDQKQYNKKFYEKHKEEINKKYSCECSGSYSLRNKSNHLKSKYHLLYEKLTKNN